MSGFVTRSGTQLMLNGSPFRFAGMNLFWLGAFDNPPAWPTHYEIDDGLNTAKEMGATVVRSHDLGNSEGNVTSIWPMLYKTHAATTSPATVDVFEPLFELNAAAFEPIDYAIWKAGTVGIKLVIPVSDNWHYNAGGKYLFVNWVNARNNLTTDYPTSGSGLALTEDTFYTDSRVISIFLKYVTALMTRINQYTGIAYCNDPTIMAWETGNELVNPLPTTAWTATVARLMKTLAPNHLVMDGTYQTFLSANLSNSDIDIFTNHYYPLQISHLTTDANTVYAAGKVFFVGEYDWTPNIGGANNATATVDTGATPPDGNNAAKVNITTLPTYPFYMQLQQGPLSITQGRTYTISFYAKADSACVVQAIFQTSSTGFTTYAQQNFNFTTSWTHFTFTNVVASATDGNVFLRFNLGVILGNLWIDNVVVTDTSVGTNMISNPSFESSNTVLTSWTLNLKATDSLPSWLTYIEGNPKISGDLFWSLFPHKDDKNFKTQGDIYTMYYPLGLNTDQQLRMQQLRAHAYRMSGRGVVPAGFPGQQTVNITAVSTTTLQWAGVAGAQQYMVETATSSSGPWTFLRLAADFNIPITVALGSLWYRVTAINVDGVLSDWAVIGNATGSGPTTVQVNRNRGAIAHPVQSGLVYTAQSGLS